MKETPKYILLANQLRQQIAEGRYSIDDKLPQEKVIATNYNVSRITVRNALQKLEDEGFIYRIQGAGTFVKDNKPADIKSNNMTLELFDFKMLDVELTNFEVKKADKEVRKELNLNEFDMVYEAIRNIKKEDEIIAYQVIHLPAKIIQGIRIDVFSDSIYSFIQQELALEPKTAIRQISCISSDKLSIKDFDFKEETFVVFNQHSSLENGQLFEWTKTFLRGEKYPFYENIKI